MYTHYSLIVKPRPDLMDSSVSAIWLEVGLPNSLKHVQGVGLHETDLHTQKQQVGHFQNKWEKALNDDKEVIDINLNSMKWMRDDLPPTVSMHKLNL